MADSQDAAEEEKDEKKTKTEDDVTKAALSRNAMASTSGAS